MLLQAFKRYQENKTDYKTYLVIHNKPKYNTAKKKTYRAFED